MAEVTPIEHVQDHVDVLIVGAGLSGIAAGYYLETDCPTKTYTILEARDAIGGTWDLFRYPGIRSDSDMFTLGYGFRPWPEAKAIADGPAIREYVNDTARENGIDRHIRFGHKVVSAAWSTDDQRWTVEAQTPDGTTTLTANFLFGCTGYYRYDEGYTPELPGIENFKGTTVHPQHWPEDLDYSGKRVVVIGSGATAVTLIPAMAPKTKHITMLQRSPSYVIALPNEDPIAKVVQRLLPEKAAHRIMRWKNVLLTMASYQLSRRRPKLARKLFLSGAKRKLPEGFDMKHFRPTYNPWDQRICLLPDGDLFETLKDGSAEIVTDAIKTFTETGIELASGEHLEADIVITATGLQLLVLGGIELSVDGRQVEPSSSITYRGMMLGDVPNFALAIGYTNASWTLKCDLICRYVTRLLNHMDANGYTVAVPRPPKTDETEPFLNLTSGYVQRSLDLFPRQGMEAPWRIHQNYIRDIALIRRGDLEEGMEFATRPVGATTPERVAA